MNIKEPLTVCFVDILAGRVRRVQCTEVMKIQRGDIECRNVKDKVVATFGCDCLEWIRPTPKKGALL